MRKYITSPGCGLCKTIDRVSEKSNCNLVYKMGLDVEIKYFNEKTRVKVAKFENNNFNVITKIREDDMNLVVLILNKLHNSNMVFKNRFGSMSIS